jgi:hypothetical protein
MKDTSPIDSCISRRAASSAAERGNYQMFLSELCDLLGGQRPDPKGPITEVNAYIFDRDITSHLPDDTTRPGWIDLYKREHTADQVAKAFKGARVGFSHLTYRIAICRKYFLSCTRFGVLRISARRTVPSRQGTCSAGNSLTPVFRHRCISPLKNFARWISICSGS